MNAANGIKGFVKQSIEDRFFEKVEKTETCWNWTGATDGRYGQIFHNGKSAKAHRVSYQLAYGEIGAGLKVCHKCDNPGCVNPEHLFLGSQSDNLKDCVQKRRNGTVTKPWRIAKGDRSAARLHPETIKRGEDHKKAKLTTDIVIYLREHKGEKSSRKFANQFGVSYSLINQVLSGKTWRHIRAKADELEQSK